MASFDSSSESSPPSCSSAVGGSSFAETRCGATGGRPAILISSTRFLRRDDSRSSRHSLTRAIHFPKMPSVDMGALSQCAAVRKEKLVVKNNEVRMRTTETKLAPTGFNAARNPSARTVPSKPPGGRTPRTWGRCISVISAERESNSMLAPTSFAAGASINWLRNQRMATANMATGNKNALKPQNWKKRSAICAPTGPIQFLAGPAPGGGADTLNDTSCGE